MGLSRRGLVARTFTLVCFAGLLVPLVSAADAATEARYPFDPACPWGRIANGKGMITRCITEAEVRALIAPRPTPVAAKPAVTPGAPAATPAPAAPAAATPPAPAPAAPVTPPPEAPSGAVKPVKVEVGPLVAEEGELGMGALHKPLDKYRECVEQNGGLSGKSGEVELHFLVRGERSRAEGVEVTKTKGVSEAAARCIADVVDRRRTGTPSAPMVGATLVFKISS